MILIAHKDDCGLFNGETKYYTVDTPVGRRSRKTVPECTCGGIKIRVELAEAHDADTFNLVGRIVSDE